MRSLLHYDTTTWHRVWCDKNVCDMVYFRYQLRDRQMWWIPTSIWALLEHTLLQLCKLSHVVHIVWRYVAYNMSHHWATWLSHGNMVYHLVTCSRVPKPGIVPYHDPCGTVMRSQVHDTYSDEHYPVALYYARGMALHHDAWCNMHDLLHKCVLRVW